MRVCAPSFIIPAGRIENVRYLSGKVEEVELLYMASNPEYDTPETEEVSRLSSSDMKYNIHMPYDRDLSVQTEWATIYKFADLLKPLNAVTHTFHMQPERNFIYCLQEFADVTGLPVSIENGGDDAHLLENSSDIPICLDIGHILHAEKSPQKFIEKYSDRICMFHLHGVADGKDHQSIVHVPDDVLRFVADFAKSENLTVSLEVFNERDFNQSLEIFNALL